MVEQPETGETRGAASAEPWWRALIAVFGGLLAFGLAATLIASHMPSPEWGAYSSDRRHLAFGLSLAGAGGAAGLVASWVSPRRRWYLALPLVATLELLGAGLCLLGSALSALVGGTSRLPAHELVGSLAGLVLGVGFVALGDARWRRPRLIATAGLATLTVLVVGTLCSPTVLLQAAVGTGSISLADTAVALGADVEQFVNPGSRARTTPLHQAVRERDRAMAAWLIRHGAHANAEEGGSSRVGITPLEVAIQLGDHDMAALLLENHARTWHFPYGGRGPLPEAAFRGDVEMVRLLLEHGARVNFPWMGEQSPLHAAAEGGSVEVIELLIEAGAEVEQADRRGMPPLYAAVEHKHPGATAVLLEHGANPDALTRLGMDRCRKLLRETDPECAMRVRQASMRRRRAAEEAGRARAQERQER